MLLRPAPSRDGVGSPVLALQPGPGMQATIDRILTDERTLHQAATFALAEQPTGSKLFVVVDQFEEVFTLCRDAAERRASSTSALRGDGSHGRTVVVIVLRADFYPRLAEFTSSRSSPSHGTCSSPRWGQRLAP